MERDLSSNIKYTLAHVFYWAFFCASVGYITVCMQALDYDSREIGLVMAAGYVLSLLLQGSLPQRIDRSKHVSSEMTMAVITAVCMGLLALCMLFNRKCPVYTFSRVLIVGLSFTIQPFINAYPGLMEYNGIRTNFSISRGVGSIGYAVTSLIAGRLNNRIGPEPIIYFAMGAAALFIIMNLALRAKRFAKPEQGGGKSVQAVSSVYILKENRELRILMLGVVLAFYGNGFLDNFWIKVIENIGGTSEDMGSILFLIALLELPSLFFICDFCKKRMGNINMLKLAMFFYCIKHAVAALAPSVSWLYVAACAQLFSYPLMLTGNVNYIKETLPPEQMNQGQALLSGAMTVACILAAAFGGSLIEMTSIRTAAIFSAVLTVGAFLLLTLGLRPRARK